MRLQQVNWLLALLLSLVGALPTSTAEDSQEYSWPQWRGPERTGVSAEKGWTAEFPKGGPEELWQTSLGVGCSSLAVQGNHVYTLGNKDDVDTVYCLDTETGKSVWEYSYDCPAAADNFEGGPCSTPTVSGDCVYTFSRNGHLFCFDAEKGSVLWSKSATEEWGAAKPTWGFSSSPLVKEELLFLLADSAVALDKSTGDIRWKSEALGGGYSSPFLYELEGTEYLAAFSTVGLVVLETESGKELFRYPWKTSYDANVATPIVSGNTLFISSGYNKGCALLKIEGDNASVVYENREMRNAFNSSVLWEGHLYGFDEVTLKCMEMQTGQEKWQQKKLGRGSLMIADGKLIVMSEKGELVVAEAAPTQFKEISRAQVLGGKCWVVPVLCNGRLYCRNNKGDLVCLNLKSS